MGLPSFSPFPGNDMQMVAGRRPGKPAAGYRFDTWKPPAVANISVSLGHRND